MDANASGRPDARVCATCQLRGQCLPDHLGSPLTAAIAAFIRPHAPVPRGTYLFRQGTPMTGYYFLRSGSAKSVFDDSDGHESIVSFLLPTDLIGAGSMMQSTYQDSAVTLERSAYCAVGAADLARLWSDDAGIRDSFLKKVTHRIQTERHARIRLDHTSAAQRVADFILELSERMGRIGREPGTLYLSMTRNDIGNYLGLAPETVSRTLRSFDDRGLVSVNVKELRIIDSAALRAVVRDGAPRNLPS